MEKLIAGRTIMQTAGSIWLCQIEIN